MQLNNQRYLIVNADDFGLSAGVNRGILEAHSRGIVTSTSLMVRWPAAVEAAAIADDCPAMSVGLHLDLGEWAFRDGAWEQLYYVVDLEHPDAVRREIRVQIDEFCKLTGKCPTHLDSHQHIHRQEPVRFQMMALADELAVPLRHCSSQVHYCGDYYGQTAAGEPISNALHASSLVELFSRLPPGVTELGCHPGYADELDTMYCCERAVEVAALCDPKLRAAIGAFDIELVSFGDIRSLDHRIPVDGSLGAEVCR